MVDAEKSIYTLTYKNGDIYKGELNELGEKEGLGVYNYANGEIYDGL